MAPGKKVTANRPILSVPLQLIRFFTDQGGRPAVKRVSTKQTCNSLSTLQVRSTLRMRGEVLEAACTGFTLEYLPRTLSMM